MSDVNFKPPFFLKINYWYGMYGFSDTKNKKLSKNAMNVPTFYKR